MAKRSKKQNAISQFHQQVLSGWSSYGKPENWDSGGDEAQQGGEETASKSIFKSSTYLLSIPVIIEQASVLGNEHVFSISLNDDTHLSISTYSKRSKKKSKETVTIHPAESRKFPPVHLVYGIHENGQLSLPSFAKQEMVEIVAQVYSQILGKINSAIQRALYERAKRATNDDSGKRSESSPTSKSVGEPKKRGGGKKIRAEVLPETVSKVPAELVEVNGAILGDRPKDIESELGRVGDVPAV